MSADESFGTGPVPVGGGVAPALGVRPDLVSHPVRKEAAARALETRLEPGTRRAGRTAEADTRAAVRALAAADGDGWASGKALHDAHDAWSDQVTALMHRLGAEKAALRGSARLYAGTDVAVEKGLRLISPLDAF
ncbi:hypothetical protein [Streptomyces abyssomicinicus]|uniref:hypothetical protein n=1 Tax=Streptomyces abyssomicinicus TaxID=574929 RepID=UPI001FEC0025|nr:hypothetical protein [Streptomyces abyssomicinicus]